MTTFPDPVRTPRGKLRAPLRPGEVRVWTAAIGLLFVSILFAIGD